MTDSRNISCSIVIPVLRDTQALTSLLNRLRSHSDQPDEIIVVNASEDIQVTQLCAALNCQNIRSDVGRGKQLDAGAAQAGSDLLWFLHADAEPHPASLESMRRAVRAGAIGGYFRFRFTGETAWYKTLLERLINLRSRFGVPYGDQGLFIKRSTYAEAGGFPDAALFEEVPLVQAARKSGRFVPLATAIGVSPRRWERDGWIRRTFSNRLLALGYMLGIPPDRLARFYNQITQQEQAGC